MNNLTIDPNAPAMPVVIHAAPAPEAEIRQKVEAVVIPFPPVATRVSELPTSMREAAPLHNNREGARKYFESIQGYKYVLADYELVNKTDCFTALKDDHDRSKNGLEKEFLTRLGNALKVINGPLGDDKTTRDRCKKITMLLRVAQQSEFYQRNKMGNNRYCHLLQDLCEAKFNGVYPHAPFKELLTNAARSAGSKGNEAIGLLTGNNLNKHTVGELTQNVNTALHKAGSDYRKDKLTKWAVAASGQFGVDFDPVGGPNVPYVRSRFTLQTDNGEAREVDFLRMGTPTIQVERGTPVTIDPMFLGMLDGMKRKDQNFLYVNHQRFENCEEECNRAHAIKGIEFMRGYENFHFMSIPLDGPITDAIKGGISIEEFKKMIVENFGKSSHGCMLPQPRFGEAFNEAAFGRAAIEGLVSHVHTAWFGDRPVMNESELKAFWGITQTVLKHAVILQLGIDRMCSTCKDNVDRGGTLSTIDEAVRQVLRGEHENQEALRQIGFNALFPYIVKLEPILQHRLIFFVETANHIARLNPKQIQRIQQDHATLYCRVTGQELAPKRLVETSVELAEWGTVRNRIRLDEEMKRSPELEQDSGLTNQTVVEPQELDPQFSLSMPRVRKADGENAYFYEKSPGSDKWGKAIWVRDEAGNESLQLVAGTSQGKYPEPFVDPKLLEPMKLEGRNILREVQPGQWEVVSTVELDKGVTE